EVEVVALAVVGVDGVGFVDVRRCGRACWPRVGLSRVLLAPPAWRHPTGFAGVSFATVLGLVVGWLVCCLRVVVVVVDVVGHTGVRGCGRGCWPWCGLSRWPWPVSMELAFPVFDVVVHSLAEDWVVELACSWSFLVPVERAFPVFDGVVYSLAEDWVVVLACSW